MTARIYRLASPATDHGLARDIIEKLFRRKRLTLTLLGLWTVGLAAFIWLQPPSYEEEIRFLIRNTRVGSPVSPEVNSGPLARDYVDETAIATEIQVLSNLKLLRTVVDSCGLATGKSIQDTEKAVQKLKKDLKIGPVLKANMIKAKYASSDPKEVESVLRNLSEGYLTEHLRAHSAAGAQGLFEKQAAFYEQRLKELQAQLTEFQSERDIVVLGQQKDLSVRRQQDLETSLKVAQTARLENSRKLAGLKEQLASLDPRVTTQSRQIPNQYSIERLNTMLVELQNRRTQLLTKFQPDERLVKEVQKQIEDTQAALSRANTNIATEQTSDVNPVRQSLEAEYMKAKLADAEYETRARSLERQILESRKSLNNLRASTPKEDELLRQMKEAEANYFLYSKKREDARIETAMDQQRISNVVLIEPPQVPAVPVPRLSLTVVAVYLLGCLLIIGARFAASMSDQTIYTAWELEGLTGSPVLAVVPLRSLGAATLTQPNHQLTESQP